MDILETFSLLLGIVRPTSRTGSDGNDTERK
jgi:hypothetical protein